MWGSPWNRVAITFRSKVVSASIFPHVDFRSSNSKYSIVKQEIPNVNQQNDATVRLQSTNYENSTVGK
jgi:hypothetical protein